MEVIQMKTQWYKSWWLAVFVVAGASFAMAEPTRMPRPGILNSVQGQVTFDGRPAQARPLRQEKLRSGQMIRTRRGKAEMLLTPGSYLRIGRNSEVRMISRSLENTRVKVIKGRALLDAEADYKHSLVIIMDGTTTRIEKKGIYGFNANQEIVSVLHGKAAVYEDGSRIVLKKKRQLDITAQQPFEVQKLNKRAFKSSALYRWNEVRNRYESRARKSVRHSIAQTGHWYGPGWYWSRFWGFYAYVPTARAYVAPFYGPDYGPFGWNDWDWGWGGWGDGDGD